MAKHINKLELNWIGKGNEPKLEPRILIQDTQYSYGSNSSENIMIHGDNLLALKALEQDYSNKIKCVYIDPPYNTGNAFEYYDDGLEHSLWLNLMRPRIEILHKLLSSNGSLWISIDDTECHYLKVLCDEIFGRNNFVADITYERSGSAGLGQSGVFVTNAEHILVYVKSAVDFNEVLASSELELKTMKRYNKVLVDEGTRELVDEFKSKSNGLPVKIYKHQDFRIETISLRDAESRISEIKKEFVVKFEKLFRTNNVQKENVFQNELIQKMDKKSLYTVDYTPSRGKYENTLTTLYYYNSELFAWLKDSAFLDAGKIQKTNKLTTVWAHGDIPKADLANEGGVDFPRSKKPEQLMKRIYDIATNEGDYVLDSFAGSGTSLAVAHKMNRKYIGVELGGHAYSHCYTRLKSVVDGEQTGISKLVNWKGGGGFKFYNLAPSLILKDTFGGDIINPLYNANMLAAAMAKQEGFRYSPDETSYWKQGISSEKDFIFTTTQFLTIEMLDRLAEEMKPGESLLVCCKSFSKGCSGRHVNITIKKIPQMLLGRCEFGRDDYSLNIVNQPVDSDDEEYLVSVSDQESGQTSNSKKNKKNTSSGQSSLF